METLRKTPLHDFHSAQGARLVPFAGWEMPVQYTGIKAEHRAVRERVGVFDVSHMGEARVTGPQAAVFLDHLLTNRIASASPGRAVYSTMCRPNGGVVDDLISYRLDENEFILCINAANREKDIAWMQQQATGFACVVRDVSDQYAQLAVQGPKAWDLITRICDWTVEDFPRFSFRPVTFAGVDVLLARTGYTGEDGVEIYSPADRANIVMDSLYEAGTEYGLALCGLGARDSLRLEAGYPLYGHEIDENINPLEAGLGWVVKLKKESGFIGKEALMKVKAEGPRRALVHFILDDKRIARAGETVYQDGQPRGRVVSGTLSPILEKPIGAALVETKDLQREHLYVNLRRNKIALACRQPPLHKTA